MLIQKSRARFTFLFALLVASILFVPFIIYGHGYFLYYGDFNVQQIPFYQMAHDAVRSGNLWWSWTTDLGANFIGSYSFYLLGSPFFWLTLPFPSAAVPYLMGPLLILKFACAAVAAYAFLRRFVKPQYASVGGLLYAFSGFSLYNIFFNHFFDAIIIFPLMLLGLEMLMKDNRRGLFGITVFFAALSNYYFFIGQVVFLLLYFLVRALSGEWTLRPVRLLSLALEAVAGTAMAGVLLLPSFFAVIQNYRTGQLVDGWNALYYSTPQRIFDIIHSFIFVQDMPAYANFFPDSANKWASMSAWLPLFGCTGALAYFQSRHHRDWLRRLLIIGVVCAVVPLFNAAFQLFNAMYYARWFYMLTLIMALATVWCFDSADVPWANDAKPTALNAAPVPLSAAHGRTKKSRVPAPASPVNWRRAIGWTLGFIVFFGLIIGLMPSDGFKHFGLAADPLYFLVIVGAALLCLVLTGLLVTLVKRQPSRFFPVGIALVTAVVLLVGWSQLAMGTASSSFTQSYMINNAINGQSVLPAPGQTMTQMERIDTGPYDLDNLGLFWNTPDIQAFHSIVPGSLMDFYQSVGVPRDVNSKPDFSHYALRSLLSVRYLYDYENTGGANRLKTADQMFEVNGTTQMPFYTYLQTTNGYRIYENDAYIPFGFAYDSYISLSDYDKLSPSQRELVMLKAIVLDDSVGGGALGLQPLMLPVYTAAAFQADCAARRAMSATSFSRDNSGFSLSIALDKPSPVFVSVPYEAGWTVTVDGRPASILRVNVGFMAVECPAGTSDIRFTYHTPGLSTGALISLCAAGVFTLYVLLSLLLRRTPRGRSLGEPGKSFDAAQWAPPAPEPATFADIGIETIKLQDFYPPESPPPESPDAFAPPSSSPPPDNASAPPPPHS